MVGWRINPGYLQAWGSVILLILHHACLVWSAAETIAKTHTRWCYKGMLDCWHPGVKTWGSIASTSQHWIMAPVYHFFPSSISSCAAAIKTVEVWRTGLQIVLSSLVWGSRVFTVLKGVVWVCGGNNSCQLWPTAPQALGWAYLWWWYQLCCDVRVMGITEDSKACGNCKWATGLFFL